MSYLSILSVQGTNLFAISKPLKRKGCTRTFQVRKPFPGEVQQHSPTFQKLYPKRQAVERVNAFL